MGTKLSTMGNTGKNEPLLNVTGEKGQYVVGKVTARKSIKSAFKNEDGSNKMREIFTLAVKDTDMATVRKENGSKEYTPCDIAEGDEVVIFAPTRLCNALRQTKDGDSVKIVYLGKGKAGKFGGKPHDFDVELL